MSDFELTRAYDTVNLWRSGGAARIELNRPDSMNAWNEQFAHDMRAAIDAVAADDGVRAVEITGAGRAFSSGADLKDVSAQQTAAGLPDLRSVLTERYHPIITAVRTMPKPVLASVNGPCVGIGLSLALAADLVVARESAYFLLAFVNIGLVPDGGASALVSARVGFTRAAEMAMLGDRVPAAQAVEWGLINRAIADEDFAGETRTLLERLAAGPTASLAGTKRQLNRWSFTGIDDQLELEAGIQQEMAGSADFIEGVTAFAEKRAARFGGR